MTDTMQVAAVPPPRPSSPQAAEQSGAEPLKPMTGARPRGVLQDQLDSLQRQVDRLRLVEGQMAALGHLGTWEIETATGRASWPGTIHRLLGTAPGEPLSLEQVLALFPAEAAKAIARALRDLRHGGPGLDLTMPYAGAAGRAGWLRVLGQAERGTGGAGCIVGIMRDVTREHELDQMLAQARRHDPLTGLGNRGTMIEELRGTARQVGSALLLVDVDQLGEVNACYGHASGDQLLLEAARRLRSGLQPGELAYRAGGHTFAVLIARDIGPEQAMARAQQLRAQLSGPLQLDTATISLAASVGAASHPAEAVEAVDLLHDAGCALDQAKAQPAGQACLFVPPRASRRSSGWASSPGCARGCAASSWSCSTSRSSTSTPARCAAWRG